MEIPREAKAVFKGIRFVIYQWRQRMFDGSYSTFEVARKSSSIVIIPTQKNKILVSRIRQPGRKYYSALFGGIIHKHETPIVAAKRELLEETGLISNDWDFIEEYFSISDINSKMYLYAARNCRQVNKPLLDPGEEIEIKTFGFDEFMALVRGNNFLNDEITVDLLRIQFKEDRLMAFKRKLFP